MPPDDVVWRYTRGQIIELYQQIQKREVKEINRQYKMIRTALSTEAPGKFVKLQKPGGPSKENKNLARIGLASDEQIKNYNPDLEVRG